MLDRFNVSVFVNWYPTHGVAILLGHRTESRNFRARLAPIPLQASHLFLQKGPLKMETPGVPVSTHADSMISSPRRGESGGRFSVLVGHVRVADGN